ncbi:transposase [Thiobacter aerophilum]|uniref:Transposase n=1 Tax=Thiobacter aerophilum TaxID=3121275 RepID=A0ABV0EJN1_9BURK
MRGNQNFQGAMFSYISLEQQVPQAHPLRKLRAVVDALLASMDNEFEAVYARRGRPSVPPEMLLKALLLQILFSIRSERLLVEAIDYNLLYRWFVGLNIEDKVWDHSTFADARLFKKAPGDKSRLCHMGHILMENRNGLIVDVEITHASGTAEREAALAMLARRGNKNKRATVGADKGDDTKDFITGCRRLRITPHVAAKDKHSAVDGRIKRHEGDKTSLKVRKRIKEAFGWIKTVGGLAKTKLIGQARLTGQALLCFATYNLVRMGSIGGWWDAHHA